MWSSCRCVRCGEHDRPYDRLPARRWRHLDIGCTRLLLEHAPQRVDCAEHGVTVAMVPWVRRQSACTRDFEQRIAWPGVHAPRSAVSRLIRVDWKSVDPICRRVADDLRSQRGAGLFDHLRSIGVDETGCRKGHTYMTVVVDHDRGHVIWMHDGRGQKVFDLFFQALTPARRESIRVVTGDGARWIDECVFRWCPMAERILDGFHIVSRATDALDKVRTAAWREARKTGTAGKGAKDPVKGARRALLKDPGRLTAGQKAQLECVANTNETLWEAYKLKERFRMILRQTAGEATPMLRQWAADASLSGIKEFSKLGEKIDRRRFDILRTIRSGLSNARLEAVNNRIKTTIKIGYGYRNLDNLIALVMLKCGGLNLQLPGRQ
ncbi:ISL3 family transposase [Bifidobacterium longum subsp. infantis]|uniref:ISL3 family transposase n=1 Tax=Bifidobacterium longum TaxID=216816 RepID=UPI00187A6BFA|nr:ISL3 family transposase [Bifidobacterium longum]QOL45617.1 ISL3 family transposase [Bifidobacterium longum subsp. infantis]